MNSGNARLFFWVGVVLALAYLPIAARVPAENAVLLKVGSVFLLVLAALTSRVAPKLLLFALTFGMLGDFFLGVPKLGRLNEQQLFMCGLVAFLVGHLFYIALFRRGLRSATLPRKLVALAIVLAMGVVLSAIKPHVGALLVPVIVYALALAVMGISAQFSRYPDVTAAGALLFVAADSMLALSHFGHPFARSGALVWLTYYAAQACMAYGVVEGQRPHSSQHLA